MGLFRAPRVVGAVRAQGLGDGGGLQGRRVGEPLRRSAKPLAGGRAESCRQNELRSTWRKE